MPEEMTITTVKRVRFSASRGDSPDPATHPPTDRQTDRHHSTEQHYSPRSRTLVGRDKPTDIGDHRDKRDAIQGIVCISPAQRNTGGSSPL